MYFLFMYFLFIYFYLFYNQLGEVKGPKLGEVTGAEATYFFVLHWL